LTLQVFGRALQFNEDRKARKRGNLHKL